MKTLLIFISLLINGVFGDEVKSVSVMEGDSLTLHPNNADIQAKNLILTWTYGGNKTSIIYIDRTNKDTSIYADVLDGRFRDRLQVNDQTGDLTITNITTQHTGPYEVRIFVGNNEKKSFSVNSVSNPESDQLKSVSVKDADSVTLHTDVPDIKKYDVIQWRFKGIPIAQFNKSASEISEYDDIHDQRFRDKLQLDVQTGSLKIKNIRTDLSGLYEVEISSTSSSYTIHQPFTVTVSGEVKSVSVMKGDPVTINTDVPDIKTYDQILLIFGCDDTIAEANNMNKQFNLYGRIRDELKLNDQTGDLTITNIRNEDAGDYELKMSSRRRTIQRRFRVNVSEQGGLSPGAKAGISVFIILLAAAAAAAAAGVIYYRRKMKQLGETKTLEVDEEKSADLKTKVKDIKKVDVIEWRFGETRIAEINSANNIFRTYDGDDDLFKDKLKLNDQTGDLNINDIREKHTGVYKLKIIRDGETLYTRFIVIVYVKRKMRVVNKGKSVDLKTEVKDIKRDDLIEWRFGETLIAEINPANNIFNTYDGDDDLFRDKLTLNHQTGDLNINCIRDEHNGVYKLKIIRDGETSYIKMFVFVRDERLEVNEGESADLKTDLIDIQRVKKIEWRFEGTLIAEINPANNIFSTYDDDDDLFKDKLKLNHQTGDLNINNIRLEHTGDYRLKIIRDGKTLERRVKVSFKGETKILEVDEGKSVDLKAEVTDIQRDVVIEWRFEETVIAQINPVNKTFITYDGDDDLFKNKLRVNPQTGDLTINDIREKHTGDYRLKIIRGGKTLERRFRMFFRGETKTLEEDEGKFVQLKTEVTDIKRVKKIEWRFGDEEILIAEINPANNIFSTYDGDDDLFRDKLKINLHTGNLKISDIREEHTGVYLLKIIKDGKTSYKRFNVMVKASKGKDPAMKREDSVEIEMPLLPNSSQ